MSISVIDPISLAIKRTKKILFRPVRVGKWFSLGFCAFLAQCGRGGGSNLNFNLPSSGSGGGGSSPPGGTPGVPGLPGGTGNVAKDLELWIQWFKSQDLTLLATYGGLILAGIALLALVVIWLGSRGAFMFLDGVVHNRGNVIDPWKRFRRLGNSLMKFRVVVSLSGVAWLILCAGLGVAIAWGDLMAQQMGYAAVSGIVTATVLMLIGGLMIMMINLWLHDFVVPIMYMGDLTTMAAYGLFRRQILSGQVITIMLFYLMKLVLGLAIGVMSVMAICATCCLAALPYLGAVILLPLSVFSRCYPLFFLQQYGGQWKIFTDMLCMGCDYDLRGSIGQSHCPECGEPIPQGLALQEDLDGPTPAAPG